MNSPENPRGRPSPNGGRISELSAERGSASRSEVGRESSVGRLPHPGCGRGFCGSQTRGPGWWIRPRQLGDGPPTGNPGFFPAPSFPTIVPIPTFIA